MDTPEPAEQAQIGPDKRESADTGPEWPNLSHKQNAFLTAYGGAGTLRGATLASGISRANHSRWMKQEAYATAFQTAREIAGDTLEEEARRRAFGWEEPIFVGGKIVGYKHRHSDLLLIFLLKGLRPEKYRDNCRAEHASLKRESSVVIYEPESWYDAAPPTATV